MVLLYNLRYTRKNDIKVNFYACKVLIMKQKNIMIASITFLLVLCILIFAVVFYRQSELYNHLESIAQEHEVLYEQSVVPRHDKIIEKVVSSSQLWRPVQERVQDTVVQVFTQIAAIDILQPFKSPQQGTAFGSGFFINQQGDIVTNAHVVSQAKAVWIQIPTLGKRIIDVDVVSISPERDLALLRVDAEGLELIRQELGGVPHLLLGDSDLVRRSDEVLALGYPLGQQSLKSTTGIVSGREQNMIQTSAPINPGSSGGPLLNAKGEVVGINSAGILEAQNVGYAIPVNDLKVALLDFYDVPILRKPFLGILFSNANVSLTRYLGNPEPGGCYIVEVIKGSSMEKAGVQQGDMIYEFDGHKVDLYGEMHVAWSEDKISIAHYPARLTIGQEIKILAYRKGVKKEFTLTISAAQMPVIKSVYPGYESLPYEVFGGMVVQELNLNHVALLAGHAPGLAKYAELQYRADPVLIITHIFADSQLFRSRIIRVGATINEVNGVKVRTLDEYREALRKGITNEFLTFRATDTISCVSENILVVLPMDRIIDEEPKLARDYKYKHSESIKDMLRAFNMNRAQVK